MASESGSMPDGTGQAGDEARRDGLQAVALMVCDACLDGTGGECHTPGCALWMNRAPDVSLRDKAVAMLTFEVVPASPALEAAREALRSKLGEMALHDDTGDPWDKGYMAAVGELHEFLDAVRDSGTAGSEE